MGKLVHRPKVREEVVEDDEIPEELLTVFDDDDLELIESLRNDES